MKITSRKVFAVSGTRDDDDFQGFFIAESVEMAARIAAGVGVIPTTVAFREIVWSVDDDVYDRHQRAVTAAKAALLK